MISKILVSSLLLTSLSIPTIAATTAAEFYVTQDAKTHKCAVSDKKPDGKLLVDVGTKPYATKGDAEIAMSKLAACKV